MKFKLSVTFNKNSCRKETFEADSEEQLKRKLIETSPFWRKQIEGNRATIVEEPDHGLPKYRR